MEADPGRFLEKPSLPACPSLSPDFSTYTQPPYTHIQARVCVCRTCRPLLAGALVTDRATSFLPPPFFSVSFFLVCGGLLPGLHTLSTLPQSYSTRTFWQQGLKEARLAPQLALQTLETCCFPWHFPGNAQPSPGMNQEAEETEGERGDHSVFRETPSYSQPSIQSSSGHR